MPSLSSDAFPPAAAPRGLRRPGRAVRPRPGGAATPADSPRTRPPARSSSPRANGVAGPAREAIDPARAPTEGDDQDRHAASSGARGTRPSPAGEVEPARPRSRARVRRRCASGSGHRRRRSRGRLGGPRRPCFSIDHREHIWGIFPAWRAQDREDGDGIGSAGVGRRAEAWGGHPGIDSTAAGTALAWATSEAATVSETESTTVPAPARWEMGAAGPLRGDRERPRTNAGVVPRQGSAGQGARPAPGSGRVRMNDRTFDILGAARADLARTTFFGPVYAPSRHGHARIDASQERVPRVLRFWPAVRLRRRLDRDERLRW